MKTTQRKEYTASNMGVTTNPDVILTARFTSGDTFHGRLGDLGEWAIERRVNTIQECTTDEGRHGLFPTLYALSEPVAAALSVMRGHPVSLMDGVTFFSRKALRETLAALMKASIPVPQGSALWAITELPYANTTKAAPKAGVPDPLQRELELMGSPF